MCLFMFVSASMVLWIGVDDTDSLRGMCTTFLATELIRELTKEHDLIGYPRLVRLNPNIPWKTRGNGAVCLRIGRGVGEGRTIGHIGRNSVVSFAAARGKEDPRAVQDMVAAVVERWACFEEEGTNPGFAILRSPPKPRLYWKAVRDIVKKSEALRLARGLGVFKGYKTGRGVIGALSATSWRPHDRTYEILAYRAHRRWGTPRSLDPLSVVQMDQSFPSTFNNYDYENERVVIAPHSPCPIQFGIRGDEPRDLKPAMEIIRGEVPARWLIFETNQGTDDHIVRDDWSRRKHTSTSLRGVVASVPRTAAGGHVFFEIEGRAKLCVAAYEPSKQFRTAVRALRPGDLVRTYGSFRDRPRTLNLEKLEILQLAVHLRKISNPRCPVCGKSMKSMGRDAGYRCLRGHAKAPARAATFSEEARTLQQGGYEPPSSARRHLAKPLKRMTNGRSAAYATPSSFVVAPERSAERIPRG